MSDTIAVTGLVATSPKHTVTSAGLAVVSFRLASQQRRYDKAAGKWMDGDTNWFSVVAFRQLASNVAVSLQKGHRIVVTGRLRVRDWETPERKGINVEIDADAIGHDLAWGTAAFTRSAAAAVAESEAAGGEGARGEAAQGGSQGDTAGDPAQAAPVAATSATRPAPDPVGSVTPF